MELSLGNRGEAPTARRSGEALRAANGDGRSGTDHLMEEVVESSNIKAAVKRVMRNKGGPGIDGMTVDELPNYLARHGGDLRAQMLAGTYQPKPVKRQSIAKSDGGIRELGIPTVLDRVVQQAILQVLQPRFDVTFSEHSYGFRPGRSAHDAVRAADKYIQEGRHWVADLDLEKFFDRVNHDVLMGRLAKRITDRRVLGLIRRYLEAGTMANGVAMEGQDEGTPQGGPLSPLLANVLLDEVDKELEKRGHTFVRYADDLNVYVRSERAGKGVMEMLERLFAKLRLRVNPSKSAVARPWDRKLLGYSFWVLRDGSIRRRVAPKALATLRARIRQLTDRHRGRTLKSVIAELRTYLVGWKNYFQLSQAPDDWIKTDKWLRRRLRMVQLRQWVRGSTVFRKLVARGVPARLASETAAHARRWWKMAAHAGMNTAMPVKHFDKLGLPRLAA